MGFARHHRRRSNEKEKKNYVVMDTQYITYLYKNLICQRYITNIKERLCNTRIDVQGDELD